MNDESTRPTGAATGDAGMNANVHMVPNPPTPNQAVAFDGELCTGCNRCVEICRSDVLMPNPEVGKPPIVLYPDECWYCGTCVQECHLPGSIELLHPLHQSISVIWVRKATGVQYRLGMRDAPPANERPPCG